MVKVSVVGEGLGGGSDGHGDGLRILTFAVGGGEDEVVGASGVGFEEEGVVLEDIVGTFRAGVGEGGHGMPARGDSKLDVGVADIDLVGIRGRGHGDSRGLTRDCHGEGRVSGSEGVAGGEGEGGSARGGRIEDEVAVHDIRFEFGFGQREGDGSVATDIGREVEFVG